MDADGPAQRAALWETWEQVEGRTSAELKDIYRAALHARGVDAPDAYLTFMAVAMVGGSWTGADVAAGARRVRERVATHYRDERERRAATKPLREQIHREVAAGAAGKTREQVRSDLSAAYSAHGLEPPPAPLLGAEAVKLVKLTWSEKLLAVRDFQAFRETVWGVSGSSTMMTTARSDGARPAWTRPPAGAARMPAGPQLAVRVELTPDGQRALSRLISEWQPEAIDHHPVCWLTVGGGAGDPVAVHLGDAEIGRLGPHASDVCRESVTAAQTTQQWLRGTALLSGDSSAEHPLLLRLRIPLPRPGEPD